MHLTCLLAALVPVQDNEMLGGVSSEVIPIQFMVFANQQHSTVGIKRLG